MEGAIRNERIQAKGTEFIKSKNKAQLDIESIRNKIEETVEMQKKNEQEKNMIPNNDITDSF